MRFIIYLLNHHQKSYHEKSNNYPPQQNEGDYFDT